MIDKNDLKDKLGKLLDIDEVYDYDLDDDLILWGEKLKDYEGVFIHGEVIVKNPYDGSFDDVLFGFAYDNSDDLSNLADFILKETDKVYFNA